MGIPLFLSLSCSSPRLHLCSIVYVSLWKVLPTLHFPLLCHHSWQFLSDLPVWHLREAFKMQFKKKKNADRIKGLGRPVG